MELDKPLTTNPKEPVHVVMSLDEYIALIKGEQPRKPPRIAKGLAGICEVFNCSRAHAFKIAHEPWFQEARLQISKQIIFDADKAWDLAHANYLKTTAAAAAAKKPAGKRA